jgi:arginine repressor
MNINHINIAKQIQKELKDEGINISQYTIRRVLLSFINNTVKYMKSHYIIDWIYFQFQYDIRSLRRNIDRNPDKYKTKYFD